METIGMDFLFIVAMSLGVYVAVRLALRAAIPEMVEAMKRQKNNDANSTGGPA